MHVIDPREGTSREEANSRRPTETKNFHRIAPKWESNAHQGKNTLKVGLQFTKVLTNIRSGLRTWKGNHGSCTLILQHPAGFELEFQHSESAAKTVLTVREINRSHVL